MMCGAATYIVQELFDALVGSTSCRRRKFGSFVEFEAGQFARENFDNLAADPSGIIGQLSVKTGFGESLI